MTANITPTLNITRPTQECGVSMKEILYILLLWMGIVASCYLFIKKDARIFIQHNVEQVDPPEKRQEIIDELEAIDNEEELSMLNMRIQALQFINGSDDDQWDYEHFIKLGKN